MTCNMFEFRPLQTIIGSVEDGNHKAIARAGMDQSWPRFKWIDPWVESGRFGSQYLQTPAGRVGWTFSELASFKDDFPPKSAVYRYNLAMHYAVIDAALIESCSIEESYRTLPCTHSSKAPRGSQCEWAFPQASSDATLRSTLCRVWKFRRVITLTPRFGLMWPLDHSLSWVWWVSLSSSLAT
jgi:hypothetical protein